MLSHTLTRTSSKSWFVSCSLQKSSVINWSFIEYLLPLVGVIFDDSNLIESGGNNCYLFISYIMSYTLKELIVVKENLHNMCGFEKLRFKYKKKYCKPTIIRDHYILQITWDKLVGGD